MCRVQPGLQLADAHLILVLEDVPGADRPSRLQLLVLLQSLEQVTILLVLGAQSIPVTLRSCWSN